MGESAAAGLFPGQMFIEYGDVIASTGELFPAHGAGRTTTDNRYFSHCYIFLACRKSIGMRNASFGGFGEPSNMDNQQAETFEEYSIENRGGSQWHVRFCICSGHLGIDGFCRSRNLKERTF
jgi:hypothetical protein